MNHQSRGTSQTSLQYVDPRSCGALEQCLSRACGSDSCRPALTRNPLEQSLATGNLMLPRLSLFSVSSKVSHSILRRKLEPHKHARPCIEQTHILEPHGLVFVCIVAVFPRILKRWSLACILRFQELQFRIREFVDTTSFSACLIEPDITIQTGVAELVTFGPLDYWSAYQTNPPPGSFATCGELQRGIGHIVPSGTSVG
jgi:hypothetical protein